MLYSMYEQLLNTPSPPKKIDLLPLCHKKHHNEKEELMPLKTFE